ncbi:MAG: hypothetical protein AAF926_07880 [Pseudomonadota bacterium]
MAICHSRAYIVGSFPLCRNGFQGMRHRFDESRATVYQVPASRMLHEQNINEFNAVRLGAAPW